MGGVLIAFVYNPGGNSAPVSFASIGILGSADFSIVPTAASCGSTLGVGQICLIAVQFNPMAGGSVAGKLVIRDNALNSPQVVFLDGQEEFFFYY
jgi:hypothetical protein